MIHNLTPDLAEACKTLGNLSLDLSLFPDPPEDVLRRLSTTRHQAVEVPSSSQIFSGHRVGLVIDEEQLDKLCSYLNQAP